MKDAVKKRKEVLSSRHSAVSSSLPRSESGRSSSKQYSAKPGTALEERIKMAKLTAEQAEYMRKKTDFKQQEQRLKIVAKVAKPMAWVKSLENSIKVMVVGVVLNLNSNSKLNCETPSGHFKKRRSYCYTSITLW